MADNENGLDAFMTIDNNTTQAPASPVETPNKKETSSLEDEFTKLLNDFISQDSDSTPQSPVSVSESNTMSNMEAGGLDSLISPSTAGNTAGGLDNFAPSNQSENMAGGLDGLISSGAPANTSGGLDGLVSAPAGEQTLSDFEDTDTDSNELLETLITQPGEDETEAEETNEGGLKAEEQELARAVTNFKDGVEAMAGSKNLRMPQTDYTEDMLKPNYKPSTGKKIAQYLLDCWDIINKYDPENMKRLSPEATDEEYLSFAEGLNDTYMQLAIISYVEILINIEICEVSYEQKKELAVKNRIKRELYEEYMELQERKNLFIQKLKEKNFPIDADRLINNYFRAAQKDADGAFEALTKNPAMFAPIQFEKMRPKFFGLIKVTPEDGIKANQKIGAFIKKLKV